MAKSKKIYLSNGKYSLVDEEDYDLLMQHKWHYSNSGYASKRFSKKTVSIHRFVMDKYLTADNLVIDHINRNRLDNRKSNLRVCTTQQNCWYRKTKAKSGYRGVYWHNRSNLWYSQIRDKDSKKIHIGMFNNVVDAAKAYDVYSKKLHGDFAVLNFN